jgi:hypothetical protein
MSASIGPELVSRTRVGMMTNPISPTARTAARAAAERLAEEYGPGLPAEVETVLRAQGTARRPDHYLDPVALGSLIVAIATLVWTVYSDQRKKTPEPSPHEITRHVLNDLNNHGITRKQETEHIIKIVVIEVIEADQNPDTLRSRHGKRLAERGLRVWSRLIDRCRGRDG